MVIIYFNKTLFPPTDPFKSASEITFTAVKTELGKSVCIHVLINMSDPYAIYCQQLLYRDVNTFSCRSLKVCSLWCRHGRLLCFTFTKKITSYTDAHVRWVGYGTACCCLRWIRPIIRLINRVCRDLLSNFFFKIALTVTVKSNFLQTIILKTLRALNVRTGYLTRLPTQDCDSYDDGPASVLSVRHWHWCWNHVWLQRDENLTSGLYVGMWENILILTST